MAGYRQAMFTVVCDVATDTLYAIDPAGRELAAVQVEIDEHTGRAVDDATPAYAELARLAAERLAEWYS
jgi:hypothetical protein